MSDEKTVAEGVEGSETGVVATPAKEVRTNLGLLEFVDIAWQCKSAKEVAARTGLKTTSVLARMSKCRNDKIPMPSFPRGGGPKRDVASAIALGAEKAKAIAEAKAAEKAAVEDASKLLAESAKA